MAMKSYPKVRRPSHSSTNGLFDSESDSLVITEKLDGNNYRFQRDGDKLRFGSRNVDLGTEPSEIGGMFEDVTHYLLDTVDTEEIAEIEWEIGDILGVSDVTLTMFGENAVQHTIDEYDWERMPQFNVFDVYCSYNGGDAWLRWDELPDTIGSDTPPDALAQYATVENIASRLGLETVPVITKTTVGGFLEDGGLESFEVPESTYRLDDGPAEGVVFRNEQTGIKAKRISEPFAERHQSAKSSNYDTEDGHTTDHRKFLSNHVTTNRIEKNIAKLIESPETEYDELEMPLMSDLHLQVWRDVWAEDYEEIIAQTWTLDLDELHNDVANKCASHLKRLIQADESPVVAVDPERGDILTDPSQ